MNAYKDRTAALCKWMQEKNIDAVFIEDTEGRRDASLRYFSGMPSDAVLIILAKGKSVLVPWDEILAGRLAVVDEIIPFCDFDRNPVKALEAIAARELKGSGRIEVSMTTPHLLYGKLSETLSGFEIVCRENGFSGKAMEMRAVKDEAEIGIYRRAAAMTDRMIEKLAGAFESGEIRTELEAAMLIESASRELGAEGPSFETLAAGPSRSWGIHAYPCFTSGAIGGSGLSLVDCGLSLEGYATDITMGIAAGSLTAKQQEMLRLVKEAHELAAGIAGPGASAADIAKAVDDHFAASGWTMPHSLGHGVGLDVHEAPYLKNSPVYDKPLEPGMIFTIEPGLYDPEAGGIRLEDDFLVTETGVEKLTSSRILKLR